MANAETQVFVGTQIDAVRLISIKHQLRLEKAGMSSSGGALRPRLAAEFGLKPRDSHDKFIATIEARIEAIKAAITAK